VIFRVFCKLSWKFHSWQKIRSDIAIMTFWLHVKTFKFLNFSDNTWCKECFPLRDWNQTKFLLIKKLCNFKMRRLRSRPRKAEVKNGPSSILYFSYVDQLEIVNYILWGINLLANNTCLQFNPRVDPKVKSGYIQ